MASSLLGRKLSLCGGNIQVDIVEDALIIDDIYATDIILPVAAVAF